MKNIKTIAVFALTLALVACQPGGDGGSNIAYVDVQKILRDSKSGKDLTRQAKSYGEKVEKRVRPEQKRLAREQKRLETQRTTLSAAALQTKESSFRQKVARFQQKIQEENKKLQAGMQESLSEIDDVLEQIYTEVKDKNDIDILINGASILEGSSRADVTQQVMEILDERLPKVKLEVPKE